MSDGDYLITAMGLFMTDINNSETSTANYLLPIPSSAQVFSKLFLILAT
jgi:hypothetical protein